MVIELDYEEQSVLDEIFELTHDEKSKNFWVKCIKELGSLPVLEEVRELKYQMHQKDIENPAKYLTVLLKKKMGKNKENAIVKQESQAQKYDKLKTYFENNQLTLLKELQPKNIPDDKQVEDKLMEQPYSKNHIPWLTFIGPEFFTLSTNKAKSDRILIKFQTMEGEVLVPVVRGKYHSDAKEYGILNAQHGKVLAAIKHLWATQGCQYHLYKNGSVCCYCYISTRELAKVMGWKDFGGHDLIWLTNIVTDLKAMPYFLDISKITDGKVKGYGFTLLNNVTLLAGDKGESLIKVEFSDPVSRQLLNRRAVSRDIELPQIRSELAFLLMLYLEPRLISLNGVELSKELKSLINDLKLPLAGWHQHVYKRKEQFEKALPEINGYKITDGRTMTVSIVKGLFDYLLVARLA